MFGLPYLAHFGRHAASPFLLCHIPGVPHSLFLVLFWFALSLRGLSSPHAFKRYLYVGRYYLLVHISSSHLPPKSLHVHPTAWHTSPLRCLLHLSDATCPNLDFWLSLLLLTFSPLSEKKKNGFSTDFSIPEVFLSSSLFPTPHIQFSGNSDGSAFRMYPESDCFLSPHCCQASITSITCHVAS